MTGSVVAASRAAAAAVVVAMLYALATAAPVRALLGLAHGPAEAVEVVVTPLGGRRGIAGEVWLDRITSSCGEVFDPARLVAPAPWIAGHRGRAAVWPGGEPTALRYRATLCSPVEVVLAHHPQSGRARLEIRVDDVVRAAHEVDLEAPARDGDPYAAEAVAWEPTRADRVEPPGPRTIGVLLLAWLVAWAVLEGLGGGTAAGRAVRRLWARVGPGAPALVVWLGWWLAFHPGIVAYDPLTQWQEVLDGRLTDWHSAAHTLFFRAIAGPWGPFSRAGLLQVVTTAALVGAVLATLRRLGAPGAVVWGLACWMAFSPAYGFNVVAVWKDAPFALCLLAGAWLVLRSVEDGGLPLWRAVALGVVFGAAMLLRHNGVCAVAPALAALAWRHRVFGFRRVALAAGVCVATFGVVKVPVYEALGVEPPPVVLTQHMIFHRVAAHAKARTPLKPRERRFLARMLPLPAWRASYACVSSIRLLFASGLDTSPAAERPGAFLRLWWRLARRNPGVELAHWACVTRFVWDPLWPTLYIGPIDAAGATIDPNRFHLANASRLPALHRRLTRLVDATFRFPARVIVWQPATHLWLVLVALGVAWWRTRSEIPIVVLAPALGNTLGWLLLPSSPDLRFQWPVLLLAPVAVALATLPRRALAATRDAGAPATGVLRDDDGTGPSGPRRAADAT